MQVSGPLPRLAESGLLGQEAQECVTEQVCCFLLSPSSHWNVWQQNCMMVLQVPFTSLSLRPSSPDAGGSCPHLRSGQPGNHVTVCPCGQGGVPKELVTRVPQSTAMGAETEHRVVSALGLSVFREAGQARCSGLGLTEPLRKQVPPVSLLGAAVTLDWALGSRTT